MKIKLAATRGYCFGVDHAIELAEKTLAEQPRGSVYVLGPVIHNEQAIKRLADMGLKQVDSLEDIPTGCSVLIRSHGVEPEIIDRANQLNLHIVDASCRLVKRAQRVVQDIYSLQSSPEIHKHVRQFYRSLQRRKPKELTDTQS